MTGLLRRTFPDMVIYTTWDACAIVGDQEYLFGLEPVQPVDLRNRLVRFIRKARGLNSVLI